MKVSIITASYNYAQYLEEAIGSVISQAYGDWELIIVDDGSSDNSLEIINSFCDKDSRIKLFQHEGAENKGLKETLQLGLKNSSGDWVCFLESDDVLKPQYLERKIEAIEKNPEAGLIFNKAEFLCESDNAQKKAQIFAKRQDELGKFAPSLNMFKDFAVFNPVLTFSCVMVKKDLIDCANFDVKNEKFLDWWLWIHLAHENKFVYVDEDLTIWRLHDSSYMGKDTGLSFAAPPVEAYFDVFLKTGDFLVLPILIFSLVGFYAVRILNKCNKLAL